MKKTINSKSKSHKTLFFNVKKSVLALFSIFFVFSCSEIEGGNFSHPIKLKEHIKLKMTMQEDAWNEGNLEGFMEHYWKSDSLRFIGKSGLNYGWQTTLGNYKKSYKTKSEMGILKFNNKSIEIIEDEIIFVIGEWKLIRGDSLGNLNGMYSLIWQQKNGKWVITTDHSS